MNQSKMIRLLAVVAVVQLGLVALNWRAGSGLESAPQHAELLAFDPAAVDALVIEGDGQTLTLKKQKQWQTPSGFPADQSKVTQVVTQLAHLKHGLAVATSETAWSRFQLGQDHFERHVRLKQGDKVIAELYLGKGAGARQSYARRADDPVTYRVNFGSYQLPLAAGDWQDKALLQVPSEQVKRLQVGKVQLSRQGAAKHGGKVQWVATPTPAGKQLDQPALDAALGLFDTLRFTKVIGSEAPKGVTLDKPALRVRVQWGDKQREYRFFKAPAQGDAGDGAVLQVSDRPEFFAIASYTFKAWQEKMNSAKWFVDPPAAADSTGAASKATGSGSTAAGGQAKIPPTIAKPHASSAAKEPASKP